MFWITTFSVIFILIAFNALYVAAEFSTVSARPARLSHLAEQGNLTAKKILEVVENPQKLDAYVATCQVGITISSLVLGFYGQAQLSGVIAPLLVQWNIMSEAIAVSFSATLILIVLTIFQVLLGELVPKNIGIRFPERFTLLTSRPMQWSATILKPLIWLFNGSGIMLMRISGLEPSTEHAHIHSPEEIAFLLDESRQGGMIKDEEHRLLINTLQMREAQIRQVMIPRARMLAAPESCTPEDLLKLLADSPYSRIPIYRDTIDHIVGVIHLRDLLLETMNGKATSLNDISHSVPFVPETLLVKEVFALLQKKQFQVAIILDEFGGTAGMVTLEDLLEEIFGDLQDEFDSQLPEVRVSGDRVWMNGAVQLFTVNELLELDLPEDEVDTIGGLILNMIGHVPITNDEVMIGPYAFRVEEMQGQSIAFVSFKVTPDQASELQSKL